MKFSIVMPVYNREGCVNHAIQSIKAQDYSDWELLIVNDGSTDNTLEVCRAAAEKDARIIVFDRPNGGVSAARNTALRNVTGDYVLFLDSDDMFASDALSEIQKTAVGYDMPDIIAFGVRWSSGGTWAPSSELCGKRYSRDFIRSHFLAEHLNAKPQTACFLQPFVWNKAYKAELLRENGLLFDESRRTWEDNIFYIACLDKADSMVLTSSQLYQTGDSGNNDHLSSFMTRELLYDYIRSYDERVAEFGGEFNFDTKYTNNRYCTLTSDILRSISANYSEAEYEEIIQNVFNNKSVQFWFSRLKCKSRTERRIRRAFKKKDSRRLRKALVVREKLPMRIKIFLSRIKHRLLRLLKK